MLKSAGVGWRGSSKGSIEGSRRSSPESLDQWVEESNAVRVIDAFVEQLDLDELGFKTASLPTPDGQATTRRCTLKLYIYGYLNRIQSSRRLERECERNPR